MIGDKDNVEPKGLIAGGSTRIGKAAIVRPDYQVHCGVSAKSALSGTCVFLQMDVGFQARVGRMGLRARNR